MLVRIRTHLRRLIYVYAAVAASMLSNMDSIDQTCSITLTKENKMKKRKNKNKKLKQ